MYPLREVKHSAACSIEGVTDRNQLSQDGDDDDGDSSRDDQPMNVGWMMNYEERKEEQPISDRLSYYTVRPQTSISLPPEAEVERLLTMTTPSPSPPISLSPPLQGSANARCTAPHAHSTTLNHHHLCVPSNQNQNTRDSITQALNDAIEEGDRDYREVGYGIRDTLVIPAEASSRDCNYDQLREREPKLPERLDPSPAPPDTTKNCKEELQLRDTLIQKHNQPAPGPDGIDSISESSENYRREMTTCRQSFSTRRESAEDSKLQP
ncbi:hypothetical protein Tco_1405412 [Tanacetum coccineum]